MILMDGKALAEKVKCQVKVWVDDLPRRPGLAVILVGEDPASRVYVTSKRQDCAQCGLYSEEYALPATITQQELLELIAQLNQRVDIDGILVQLPLPAGLNEGEVLLSIAPEKDVDGFHPMSVGQMALGQTSFVPCTPAGVMAMLKEYNIDPAGQHCVVVGRSNIVGKPMARLLLAASGTVTICHSRTPNLADICRQADILVSAVGQVGLITGDMLKDGVVVVDVAMNRNESGKLCGDIDVASVGDKVSYLTPVPGGVGPMTRAMLMKNTLQASQLRQGK